jgi:hypothetical protein
MRLLLELWELLFAAVPVILCTAIICKPARKIAGWTFQVLASATVAVLSMGFLLMRLTTPCSTAPVQCGEGLIPVVRTGSPFGTCHVCATSATPDLLTHINAWSVEIQGISAALCVIGSTVTIFRFVFWARKVFAASQSTNQ